MEEVRDKRLMNRRLKFDVELGDCAYALKTSLYFFLRGQYLLIMKFHRIEIYTRPPPTLEPMAERRVSKLTQA